MVLRDERGEDREEGESKEGRKEVRERERESKFIRRRQLCVAQRGIYF